MRKEEENKKKTSIFQITVVKTFYSPSLFSAAS